MLAAFFGYLVVHVTLYVLLCRQLTAFQRERTILRYHAIPALAVTVLCAAAFLDEPTSERFAEAVIVIGLQGIYSLSFLELWSLAQIGYSLAILMGLDTAQQTGTEPDLKGLEAMGAAKRAGRIKALTRLGLVDADGALLRLTRWGGMGATALNGLARLVNDQRTV
jgi:hypothetical protein